MQNDPRQGGRCKNDRLFSREPQVSTRLRFPAKRITDDQAGRAKQDHGADAEVDCITQASKKTQDGAAPPGNLSISRFRAESHHSQRQCRGDSQQENVVIYLTRIGQGDGGQCETDGQEQPGREKEVQSPAKSIHAPDGHDVGHSGKNDCQGPAKTIGMTASGHSGRPLPQLIVSGHPQGGYRRFIRVIVSVDEQLIECAVFEKICVVYRVGQGSSGRVRTRNLHENRLIDDPGMPINERFDRGQSAAIVPTASVGAGHGNGNHYRDGHRQGLGDYLPSLSRGD